MVAVGTIRRRSGHSWAPRDRPVYSLVHSGGVYGLSGLLGFLRFIRGGAYGSFWLVLFIRGAPRCGQIHSGSLGSFGGPLVVIRGRSVHSEEAYWSSGSLGVFWFI